MKSRASNSRKASPTEASGPTPIERITQPFQESAKTAVGGVLLLTATVLALAWANSPWAENLFHALEAEIHNRVRGPLRFQSRSCIGSTMG